MNHIRRKRRILLFMHIAALAGPALAQRLTIEPVTGDDHVLARRASAANDPAEALSRYLRVLAREPRDLEALTGAGKASLDIGDANAAISFYARAEELAPRDGRIKAGLGSAMVQLIQPRAALKLFDEAVGEGVPVADIASDRGLAYALRGDSRHALADYELALTARPDDETTRRLAIAQAIDGETGMAMATLDALLRRHDKAAWRDRVFIQAISGDVSGAETTANAVLPSVQAAAIRPFLARLAKLRPSQQAAAVHFGQFPSDGREYSEAELFAAAGSAPPLRPEPRDLPRSGSVKADEQGDGIAEPRKRRDARSADADRDPVASPSRAQKTIPVLKKATKPDVLAKVEPEPAAPSAKAEDMAKDMAKPAKIEVAPLAKRAGKEKAPDLKAGKPAKLQTTAKEKKEPERHWVQVATGAYKPDLGKAWAKLKDKHPALLSRRSAWTTPLNRTNRLLIGPFRSAEEAQAFVNKAAGSGFMTSTFKNTPNQVIEPVKQ